jgi:protein-serine/threonine kinase
MVLVLDKIRSNLICSFFPKTASSRCYLFRIFSLTLFQQLLLMASSRRPLPPPPGKPMGSRPNPNPPVDLFTITDPYFTSYAYPAYSTQPPEMNSEHPSGVPVGTLLHKGFYDLLSMIPTPSPSRLLGWGAPASSPPVISQSVPLESEPTIAGPPYESLQTSPTRAAAPAQHARKGRRVSKDMVSKPTGFVYA